jgi:hypothetical protein
VVPSVFEDDAAALTEAGGFMLYDAGNLAGAIIYLERAHAAGTQGVAIDLAVAALFDAQRIEPGDAKRHAPKIEFTNQTGKNSGHR